jgi:RibD C-terminal domain
MDVHTVFIPRFAARSAACTAAPGPAEAVRIGLAAAGGKNLEVFSPTIGRRLLELGLVDEIDLHIAPILLGEGCRLYDSPGGEPVRLHRIGEGDPALAVNVRYRSTATTKTRP